MWEEQKRNHERVESAGCVSEAGNQQEKDIKIYLSHDGLFGFAFDKKNVGGGAMMSTVFEQVLEKGKEIGVKEGEERGEEKNKLKVALNCLIKGMDIQTIAEITDLPVERIERLKTAVQKENTAHQ